MPTGNPLLDMAVNYASRYDWRIFPLHHIVDGKCSCNRPDCQSPGKHPRTYKGVLDATTDPKQLFKWWSEWPKANVGVATGKGSGIVVLDLDVKSDGLEHWADLRDMNGQVETLTSITGSGGAHWIFVAPQDGLRSTVGQIARGIDTRAEGGYIVAPPSNHVQGQYQWDNNAKPCPMPDWLFNLWPKYSLDRQSMNGHFPDPKDAPHWVNDYLNNGAPEGERNNAAHRLAGYFRSKSLPRDISLTLLQDFSARCIPPISIAELKQCVDSAQRYAVQVAEARISDPPEFEERLGILTYTWRDPGIRVQLEQLHRNRLGVQSEITVDSIGGEQDKYIWGPVSYNLTSTSGREALLRALTKRWELDWGEILEKLSRMVAAYLRLGHPVQHLRDYMHRPASQWVLNPLILEDQPSLLFGPGGLGKSLIGLAAMLTAESGSPILPGLASEIGHRGIYLDWEKTGIYEHGVRYRKLLMGAGLEPSKTDCLYLSCTGSMTEVLQTTKRVIDQEGVTFAVIDSAGFACGGEPEKAEFALQFFDALHQLEIPALVIAHQSKGDTKGMPFGSVFWHNAARSTWEIRSVQVAGESLIKVGLFNRKSNVGSLSRPLGYSISFSNSSITFDQFDPRTNAEMAEGVLPVSEQIAALLEGEAMSIKQIAETLGKTEQNIGNQLRRNKTRFTSVGSDQGATLWGLLYNTG